MPEIHRIYLEQLAEELSSPGIDLVRLIVEPESTAVERAKQLLNQAPQTAIANLSQKAIKELIETIVVYKFPQLSRQEIEQMLNLTDLKQTKVYQEALAEALEQGKRQEGLTLITRLLARKFGDLPPTLRFTIERAVVTHPDRGIGGGVIRILHCSRCHQLVTAQSCGRVDNGASSVPFQLVVSKP